MPFKYPRRVPSSTGNRLSRTGRDATAWRIGIAQRSELDRLDSDNPRLKVSLAPVRFFEVEEAGR